jgi:hypothetical protein
VSVGTTATGVGVGAASVESASAAGAARNAAETPSAANPRRARRINVAVWMALRVVIVTVVVLRGRVGQRNPPRIGRSTPYTDDSDAEPILLHLSLPSPAFQTIRAVPAVPG